MNLASDDRPAAGAVKTSAVQDERADVTEREAIWQGAIDRVQRLARTPQVVLAVIVAFGFLIYLPTLNDWFQTDDFVYLRTAQLNSSPEHLLHAWNFKEKTEQTVFPVQSFYGHFQPLYEVTIVSEAELFGLRAWPYHALSLLMHLANGVLVWLIVMKLAKRPLVAHLASLIFLVHPTYASAVAWISDQVALAATTCSLLALLAFINSLESGPKARRWYAISVASFMAAVLFHPKAAFVLPALGAYYFFVYCADLREMLSPRAWLRFVPYVVGALFLLIVGLWLQRQTPALQGAFGYGPHVYKSYEDYLRMALIPDPWFNDMGLRAAGALAWVAISAWLLRDVRYRPVALLGLLWLAASLFPLTTFKWGAYNRELYTAGPAVALLLAMLLVDSLDRVPKQAIANALVAGALAAALGVVGMRTLLNEDVMGDFAEDSRAFSDQLQETYPTLPQGATLYVVDTPFILNILGDVHLNELGQVYYGHVELHTVSEPEAQEIEQSRRPKTFVFRYVSR